jgi:type IV pilus assembly protein PilQ
MTRTLSATLLAAALLTGAASAYAAPPAHVPRAPRANPITALSVVPATGRAEVVLTVDGSVDVMDFTLENPRRIVVDLKGATLGMPARLYDKVSRGGITNLRYAQYKPDVVRLVLDVDGPREYTVVRGENEVRIAVNGPDAFAAWRVGAGKGAVAVTDVVVQPTTTPIPVAATVATAPPQPVAPPAPAKQPERAPDKKTNGTFKSNAPPASQEPRITITFIETHIRDVITAFAAFSQRTIIIGKAVDGTFTGDIIDKPWDIALKQILSSQGYTALEDSTGIITVDSYQNLADREKVEPLIYEVIPVNYAKAAQMSQTVASLLTAGCGGTAAQNAGNNAAQNNAAGAPPGAPSQGSAVCSRRGAVTFDDKTNTLIVTETASHLAEIRAFVRDLDVRTPQVTIKAKIIAVDRTGTEQLGLSYDLGSANGFSNALVTRFQDNNTGTGNQPVVGDYRINLAGDAFAGVANASRPYKSTSTLSLIYNMTLGGFNLSSFLDALSSTQLSDVQAEPSTTTVDNKEAILFAGTQLSFLLTPPVIPGQVSTATPQLQRQDIGITLRVTPHVTANRQVLLNVYAEQQSLVGVTVAGPNVNKRNATNEVLVPDGESAVIAGLTQTQITYNKTGIPFLMDLPGIGKLFSSTEKIERKQDLLILITPHIVDEGEVVRSGTPTPVGKP